MKILSLAIKAAGREDIVLPIPESGNEIDVYLSPLVEDLRKLWDEGVAVFDAFRKETFEMRVMLFCTIK